MNNGIEYYFVEVTCKDGIQYGIQAFGQEAITLHEETMKLIQENQEIVFTYGFHEIGQNYELFDILNQIESSSYRIVKRVQKVVLVVGFVYPDSCLGSSSV